MAKHGNTFIRSLHDVGGAAWFGGSLMGTIGLNGASRHVSERTERAAVAAAGWARWTPANVVAIAAHLVGGAGLVLSQRRRVLHQSGTTSNTVVKSVLTALALGTTAYSGALGARVGAQPDEPAEGGTVPATDTSPDMARLQQRLRVLQWATPVLTGAILVLAARQGEQQRPLTMMAGLGQKALDRAGDLLST